MSHFADAFCKAKSEDEVRNTEIFEKEVPDDVFTEEFTARETAVVCAWGGKRKGRG